MGPGLNIGTELQGIHHMELRAPRWKRTSAISFAHMT